MRGFLIVFCVILLVGCSSGPNIVNHAEKFSGQGSHEVFIVSHGWHTGFVIDAQQVQYNIPELEKRFGETRYIEFGWGDIGFYQAKEITSGLTLRAIFWPTESVMHVVSVPQNVQEYFANSEVEMLCMNDSELLSLIRFIEQSFYRDEHGDVIELKKGIYGDSQFYKGVGDYYLMNTCNKWTAKGLKSAGMDIFPTFKLTSDSIMNFVRAYKKELFANPVIPLDISLQARSECQ